MNTSDDNCVFHQLYGCQQKKEKLQNGSKARVETVRPCSKQLNDSYHVQLETLVESEPDNPCSKVHKSSTTNIQAYLFHIRKLSVTMMTTKRAPQAVAIKCNWLV